MVLTTLMILTILITLKILMILINLMILMILMIWKARNRYSVQILLKVDGPRARNLYSFLVKEEMNHEKHEIPRNGTKAFV